MSRAGEAFYLPALFLTVTLLGGVRVTHQLALAPPSLFALVLAMVLFGALIGTGTLAPERLMNQERAPLANLNGLVLILTMFIASAQMFSLVTPESGLPRLVCSLFFVVLLLNTLAASPDRIRLLRSLVVIFGSAFTLKFILLAALSAPEAGVLKRMLLVALEGLTLGVFAQPVFHPVTGYLAFVTLVLFMVGLVLVPSRDRSSVSLTHHQGAAAQVRAGERKAKLPA